MKRRDVLDRLLDVCIVGIIGALLLIAVATSMVQCRGRARCDALGGTWLPGGECVTSNEGGDR